MKKVFFIRWKSNSISLAQKIESELDAKIILWTAKPEHISKIRAHSGSQYYLDDVEAIREPKPSFLKMNHIIPQEVIDKTQSFKESTILMMDRMDINNSFSRDLREVLFEQLVSKSYALCRELKPDLILYPETPHLVYDYVLYEMAKILNIKNLLFERTFFANLQIVASISDFEYREEK